MRLFLIQVRGKWKSTFNKSGPSKLEMLMPSAFSALGFPFTFHYFFPIITEKGSVAHLNHVVKRFKPHILLAHEALLRTLKPHYKFNQVIYSDYQKYKAGYLGESSVDYKLSLFQKECFFHYPDLRLNNHQNNFQIDSLIITPKLIFLIEAKNLKGTLEYSGKYKQIVQTTESGQTSYRDPILQVKTQAQQLRNWLLKFGYQVPIEPLVVSTNHATIIRNLDNDNEFKHRFITLENLIFKIDSIYNSYKKNTLSINDIHNIISKISSHNNPYRANLINYYNIKQQHIFKGIPCKNCTNIQLRRISRTWFCPKCKTKISDAHIRVILDYFLLHDTFITNKQCRELLQLRSHDVSYRLLNSSGFKSIGNKKGRKYLSPKLTEFPQDAEPKFNRVSVLD